MQLAFEEGAEASIKEMLQAPQGPKAVRDVAPDVTLARFTEDRDAKGHVDAPFGGSRGKWTLEVRFNGERVNQGFLKEWTLMLHGTRDPPYSDLPVTDPHSKLAIVKKAHDEKKM